MNQKIALSTPNSAMTLETLASQGHPDVHGSLVSGIMDRIHDLRKSVIKECFSRFQDTEHRMEYVANVHGIEFINDSKATNINATWYSLGSMTKPVIWIAGSVDMGCDFGLLKPLVRSKVKAIVSFGKDYRRVHEIFGDLDKPITGTRNMSQAVELALYAGEDGDVVLFSPGCASFDLYKDYEERGRKFCEAVRNL
jgi:UDP-N-acetylmuramoylalanine--D-glutamate ligase